MQIKLEWLENKHIASLDKDIKEVSFIENGITKNATIWGVDRDGKPFPNFQTLKAGDTIECTVYEKEGKITLYPPKETSGGHPVRSAGAITKAMEKKEESIGRFQDNKEMSIKIASTLGMANNTALAFLQGESIKDVGIFKEQVKRWREFYWTQWDAEDKDYPPFE